MSDPVELAKGARLILAEALQALQSASDVPDELLGIAAPIAKAMGLLLGIERSGGQDVSGAGEALDGVRTALDSLQSVGVNHPAVDRATESVAGSLSKLFALARAKPVPAAKGAPAAAPALDPIPIREPAVPRAVQQPAAQPAAPPNLAPAAPPAMTPMPAQPAATQPLAANLAATAIAATPAAIAAQPAAIAAQPAVAPDPAQAAAAAAAAEAARELAEAEARAAEARRLAEQKAAEAAYRAQEAQRQAAAEAAQEAMVFKRVPGQTDAPDPPDGVARLDVELGAHSPSNFYKGLSGNDVVDHGGIFVATYTPPKVGTAVALRVLLPGELEFEADAAVQWVRETRSGESQPGFGAKFSRISGDGRQLVYRYARNREPMFYDDF